MTVPIFCGPAAAPPAYEGPLGCYIDLLIQRLREQQFSSESVRAQVLQVAGLSRWLDATELKADPGPACALAAPGLATVTLFHHPKRPGYSRHIYGSKPVSVTGRCLVE